MDPVTQILAQSSIGSSNGGSFADSFVKGAQLAQENRRLNLMERKMQFDEQWESLLTNLQRESIELRNQAVGLDLLKEKQMLAHDAQSRAGSLEIVNLMSELSEKGTWGTPESWQRWNGIIKRAPLAALSKEGSLFMGQQRIAVGHQKMLSQFGAPNQVTIDTPEGKATFGSDPAEQERLKLAQGNLQARLQELELARQRMEQQMQPQQREQLRAGLRAIANDPLIIDSGEKLQKMEKYIQQFGGSGPAKASDPLGLFD